jgi:hypothetical protein
MDEVFLEVPHIGPGFSILFFFVVGYAIYWSITR